MSDHETMAVLQDQDVVRVYTASKTRYGPLWREYRDAWACLTEPAVHVASTWIDESGEGETSDFSDLWLRCIGESSTADLLICVHVGDEVWKGTFIEIGSALSNGVPVYVCGRPPGTWLEHPLVTVAADPDDALCDFLSRRAAGQKIGSHGDGAS